MIDVSHKYSTLRTATATATVTVRPETIAMIQEGRVPKGDPLLIARIAATQAAKNTSTIIPYCHHVPLDFIRIDYDLCDDHIVIHAEVKAIWKTGVEMEALTAASVAALTIYDMLKMIDDNVLISDVRLLSKTGGKSSFQEARPNYLRAAVLVLSDSVSNGLKEDSSGTAIKKRLISEGIEITRFEVIPDSVDIITATLRHYADDLAFDLVITTGGTGLGPRDVTPNAMDNVIDREIPGIAEAIRSHGLSRTPLAMLSRARAGMRGSTIIINLPGSERAVNESLDALFPAIKHAFKMLKNGDHVESSDRRIMTESPLHS